jgi:transcriptional regulator with XRE-family HTH domain
VQPANTKLNIEEDLMAKNNNKNPLRTTETVTLRTVAERVGLAPCSVSAILNNSAAGMSIPQHTKDRVMRAATQLNYRPNYSARSLRTKRTYTVALLAPDIGHAAAARIVAGAEDYLRKKGYCLLVAAYDPSPDWFQNHFTPLRQRGVEGIITMQRKPPLPVGFPTVFVDLLPTNLLAPMPTIFQQRLERLGKDCADCVVRQIERKGTRFGRIASSFVPVDDPGMQAPIQAAEKIEFKVRSA